MRSLSAAYLLRQVCDLRGKMPAASFPPRAALTAYEISRNRHFVPPRPSSSQFTPKTGQIHPISSLLFGKMSEK